VLDRHAALAGHADRPLSSLQPRGLGRGADRLALGTHVSKQAVEPVSGRPDDPLFGVLNQRALPEY
jgi:hypothetical protein